MYFKSGTAKHLIGLAGQGEDQAAPAAAVPVFAEIDALPGAQVEPAVADGHGYRAT